MGPLERPLPWAPRAAPSIPGLAPRPGKRTVQPASASSLPLFPPFQALHKAVLTIDENGMEHSGTSHLEESAWFRHLTIKFNRPFLVIIMDERTDIPLFVGKMVNPMQK